LAREVTGSYTSRYDAGDKPTPRCTIVVGITDERGDIEDEELQIIGSLNRQQTPRRVARVAVVKIMLSESPDEVPLQELVAQAQEAEQLARQRLDGVRKELRKRSDGVPDHHSNVDVAELSTTSIRRQVPWRLGTADLLYYGDRLYIPDDAALKRVLMEALHDAPWDGGHFGTDKTLAKLRKSYFWDAMERDVREYVRTCPVGQKVKAKHHRPYGELQSLPRPKRPFAEITMDFITGLQCEEWLAGSVDPYPSRVFGWMVAGLAVYPETSHI
jgi:hypothetical protein